MHTVAAPGDEALIVLQLVERFAFVGAKVHFHQLRHVKGFVAGVEDVCGFPAAAQRGGVDFFYRRVVFVLDKLLESVDSLLAQRVVAESDILSFQIGAGDAVAKQVDFIGQHSKTSFLRYRESGPSFFDFGKDLVAEEKQL